MKYIKYLALATLFLVSCKNNNTSKVSGTFSGVVNRTIYLEQVAVENDGYRDSVITDDKGWFQFKVPAKDQVPTFYNINTGDYKITLLISPGEKIRLKSIGNLSRNYIVEGSEGSGLVHEVNSMMYSAARTFDSLYKINYVDERITGATAELLRSYTRFYITLKQELIRFLVLNANSMAAIYALYQDMPAGGSVFNGPNDILYYKMVSDSLSKLYPESPHVKILKRDYENLEAQQNASQMIKSAAENIVSFPEIELTDIYGNNRKLSSLNGKVILIDFWISSENTSRMMNAEMKELYDEFSQQGLEVYQVSLDDSRAAWVSNIYDQRLPWINVRDPQGPNSSYARKYNVTQLPANFIINREGDIVARDIFGDDLKKIIKESL